MNNVIEKNRLQEQNNADNLKIVFKSMQENSVMMSELLEGITNKAINVLYTRNINEFQELEEELHARKVENSESNMVNNNLQQQNKTLQEMMRELEKKKPPLTQEEKIKKGEDAFME
jgi:hypothetical protein